MAPRKSGIRTGDEKIRQRWINPIFDVCSNTTLATRMLLTGTRARHIRNLARTPRERLQGEPRQLRRPATSSRARSAHRRQNDADVAGERRWETPKQLSPCLPTPGCHGQTLKWREATRTMNPYGGMPEEPLVAERYRIRAGLRTLRTVREPRRATLAIESRRSWGNQPEPH